MDKRDGNLRDELELMAQVAVEFVEVAELLRRRAQRLLVQYGAGSGEKAA